MQEKYVLIYIEHLNIYKYLYMLFQESTDLPDVCITVAIHEILSYFTPQLYFLLPYPEKYITYKTWLFE